MPSRYELQNRQHFSRAVLTGVALAFLLLFLAMAPAKILAWSGFGFGSLTVPVPVSAPAIEVSVGRPVAQVPPPPAIEPLVFPAYSEWSDIEITCADCDWPSSYSAGGALDAVDEQSLGRLERSSQLTANTLGASHYRSGSSSNPAGFGGGGSAGAGSPDTEASDAVGDELAQRNEADGTGEAESVEAATHAAETLAANTGAGGGSSAGGSSAGGSSGSGSSGSGSSASDAGSIGDGSAGSVGDDSNGGSLSDATETNLLLSPISAAGREGSGGALPTVDAAPQEVVHALAEAPVGSETVHTMGEPNAIDAQLDPEVAAVSSVGRAPRAQQDIVPEPASLMLMGLALTAVLFRLRRVVRP